MQAPEFIGGSSPRYRVESFLASGGMGALYVGAAQGTAGFERPVVLKQLRAELLERPESRERFLREAKLSAVLDHPNIVRTLDLARMGNSLVIVMEYVRGADLRVFLRRLRARRGRMNVAAVLHIGRALLSALDYMHVLGVVHRDVSPSNILLSENGEVKLSDFGIATIAGPFTWALRREPARGERVEGKRGYMAPEHVRHGWADPSTDQYSLAVCLHEALSGKRLFVDDGLRTPSDAYDQPIPPLALDDLDLPLRELDAALRIALSPDPRRRFTSAETFERALGTIARRWGLELSTRQFARYLAEVGGPPETWRDVVDAVGGQTGTHTLEGEAAEPPAFAAPAWGTARVTTPEAQA